VVAAAAGLKLRPPVFVSDASNKLSLGPSGNVDLLIQKPVFDMPANGVEVGCNEWSIGNSGSEAFDDDSPLTDPKLVEADSNEWDFGNGGSAAFDDDSPLIGLGDPKLEAQGPGPPANGRPDPRGPGPPTSFKKQGSREQRRAGPDPVLFLFPCFPPYPFPACLRAKTNYAYSKSISNSLLDPRGGKTVATREHARWTHETSAALDGVSSKTNTRVGSEGG
jgi:hypothetical protein